MGLVRSIASLTRLTSRNRVSSLTDAEKASLMIIRQKQRDSSAMADAFIAKVIDYICKCCFAPASDEIQPYEKGIHLLLEVSWSCTSHR